jgi:multidrug efflux pump subunit AcrA (membrane-fusion protein)
MKTSLFARLACFTALTFILVWSGPHLHAHEGHAHAPGEEGVVTSGPITITAEARSNLGVTVAEAELRTLAKIVTAFGQIEPIPQMTAAITSRIAGRVVNLNVVEGQEVKKGQPLVEIESLQMGDPPPRTTVTSPVDGLVLARSVVLGSSVAPAAPLLQVGDLSLVHADAFLFEGQLGSVKPGQKVRVQVESYPGEIFEGVIERMGGSLNPETRTLEAHAEVRNPDNRLRPNMRATVHILTGEAENVIAVPHSAVLGDVGQAFVFVQTDEKGLIYERRPVVTGIKDDQYIEIIEGVFPTDKVVTRGNYQLQYVTTAAKPELGAESQHLVHDHGVTDSAGHTSSATPLKWMGWVIIALLALNIVFLVRSRRSRTA